MPHGSGLDAQLGIATETTYGTRATPNAFFGFESESLAVTPNFLESQPLMGGVMVQPANLMEEVTRTVEGSIEMLLMDRGIGKFLNLLHGNTVTPSTPSGATSAREWVHPIGLTSPVGKSLTIQVARPAVTGTLHPFDYVGCKITEATISIENDGAASLSVTIDGRDELTDKTLAVASWNMDARPLSFKKWSLELAGSPSTNVQSLSFSIPLGMDTERFPLGSGGLKNQPLVNQVSEITGTAAMEFTDLASHNLLKSGPVSLVAKAVGGEIEAGHNFETTIEIPAAQLTSSQPQVGGPELVVPDLEFKAVWNGTDAPVTITQVNDDTAL